MTQSSVKHKAPVEMFKTDLVHLRIACLEYDFYASALPAQSIRPLAKELLRRHRAVAQKMDAYAREIGETANYETSLLAGLVTAQN